MNHILTEEDVKFRFITPAIEKAGWTKENIRMEYFFTEGQIFVSGNKVQRGKAKKADYLLLKNGNIPLAVIEAKKLENTSDSGLQQAMNYAEILNLPLAYSCNGKKFVEHDFLTGKERQFSLDEFPTENEMWRRYCKSKSITNDQEKIIFEPDYRSVMQNRTCTILSANRNRQNSSSRRTRQETKSNRAGYGDRKNFCSISDCLETFTVGSSKASSLPCRQKYFNRPNNATRFQSVKKGNV